MASFRRIRTRKGAIRWQSRWRVPGANGRLQDRSQNFTTRNEAAMHAAQMREIERRGVGDPHRHDLESYLRGWLAHRRERGDLAPTTLQGYERNIALASQHCGHILLEKVTARDLDTLYVRLLTHGSRPPGAPPRPLSRQSVMHAHRLLHSALKQAVKWRLIPHNPASDATPPSVSPKQARAFTAEEIACLLAAAEGDPETYCVLALLLTTGLRRSELLGLTLDALDLEAATLTVQRTVTETRTAVVVREITKTKSSRRTLAIPAAVVTLLRAQKARVLEQALAWGTEYSRGPRFLFPVNGGEPMRPLNLTARLRRLLRRAGIKGVQPVHGWRHATATLLIAGGTDVRTTQSRMGHSSPIITLALYADVVDEKDRAAGESLAGYLTSSTKRKNDV
jgi:integrase